MASNPHHQLPLLLLLLPLLTPSHAWRAPLEGREEFPFIVDRASGLPINRPPGYEQHAALRGVRPGHFFLTHNPTNITVTRLIMTMSSHFDCGCKTPNCSVHLVPGEPDRCAFVGAPNAHGALDPSGTGEPYAAHIINRYFDLYIPRAIAHARDFNSDPSNRARNRTYSYMLQPWVASIYLDCERAGMWSWPGSGWATDGMPMLHCPTPADQAALREALHRGDIFLHAFPNDGEASYFPDADTFAAALNVSRFLAADVGIAPPTTVSQRDVPGWTRATLPIVARLGISGLSFGCGTPPGKPDTPPVFVWRDEPSGVDMVTTVETTYGNVNEVFVLPNGVALCAAWQGDNTGPPAPAIVSSFYDTLGQHFPQAQIQAAPLDVFFAIASQPSVKAQLPVVTGELGDGWLYGVASDPVKNAKFKAAGRVRAACVASGECDATSPDFRAFDRMLAQVPEHTWGIALSWFFPSFSGYDNPSFDAVRAQAAQGFIHNNTLHPDINTTVNSYLEQRAMLDNTPRLLDSPRHAAFAQRLRAAMDAVDQVVVPDPQAAGLQPVADPAHHVFTDCPGYERLAFGPDADVVELVLAGGAAYASANRTLGTFSYRTYTEDDYNTYLADFAARIDGNCRSPTSCSNFRKVNLTASGPQRRTVVPVLEKLWYSSSSSSSGCRFVLQASIDAEASRNAGAPQSVVVAVNASADGRLRFEFVFVDKRPTKMPEAMFVTFNPQVPDASRWRLQVLNSSLNPLDVFGAPGKYGGSPHIRGVQSVSWGGEGVEGVEGKVGAGHGFVLSSDDVPLICAGEPNPFPTPRDRAPDVASYGVSWNVENNIWNTNYALWFPFVDADRTFRARFEVDFGSQRSVRSDPEKKN